MPKTRSPARRPCSPAGTRSATPAKSTPTTNGYEEAAVSRPRRLLSSGLIPANRTRMSAAPSAAGTGRSWTDAGSPKLRTANARILTSLHQPRPDNTAAPETDPRWLLARPGQPADSGPWWLLRVDGPKPRPPGRYGRRSHLVIAPACDRRDSRRYARRRVRLRSPGQTAHNRHSRAESPVPQHLKLMIVEIPH